jgi:hypothetical protein
MYAALSIQRLLSLVDAKHHDLVRDHWHADEGRFALEYMTALAGLQKAHEIPITSTSKVYFQVDKSGVQVHPNFVHRNANSRITLAQTDATPPLSLPIAAAHHPSHIRKLRKPMSLTTKKSSLANTASPLVINSHSKVTASITLSTLFDAEKQTHRNLTEALERTKRRREEINSKKAHVDKGKKPALYKLNLELWEEALGGEVDFNVSLLQLFFTVII